jgi:hypothetical protein
MWRPLISLSSGSPVVEHAIGAVNEQVSRLEWGGFCRRRKPRSAKPVPRFPCGDGAVFWRRVVNDLLEKGAGILCELRVDSKAKMDFASNGSGIRNGLIMFWNGTK